jgi:putative transposase
MTQKKPMRTGADWKALVAEDADLMRELVRHVMQEILEAEMTETLGAEPRERTEARQGYRAELEAPKHSTQSLRIQRTP